MTKIFVTRHIPGKAVEMLTAAGHEVSVSSLQRPLSQDELISELSKNNYDGVLSLLTDKIDANVFNAAPSVKIFSNYAVGFNNFDLAEAKKRSVVISNTPGTSTNAVAEFTMTLILNAAKRIDEGDQLMRDGKFEGWNPELLIGEEVKDKTLGLIGAGRIGSQVAYQAHRGFGMKIIYHDIVRNIALETEHGAEYKDTVEDVMKEADIVSLHTLLDETTHHLINKSHLELMKPTAILVNTSRGPVVDEVALVEALKTKRIRGAALDVYEFEPKMAEGLKELSNVTLTPHIASSTEEARNAMSVQAAENLIEFFAGREPKFKVV